MRDLSIVIAVFLLNLHVCSQSVPPLINYQGRLIDETGASVVPGTYAIQFRLWSSPTSTNPADLVWAQQQNATVFSNGVFNVILGAAGGSAISGLAPKVNDLGYAFTEANRFLGITLIARDGVDLPNPREILPRQQLLSAPFAFKAETAKESEVATALAQKTADLLCPPGTIVAFGGAAEAVPDGWILCDGREVSIAAYPRLHKTIAFAWGDPKNGNFRVPDLRGVFLRGVDNSPVMGESGRDPDRGDAGRGQIHPGGNFGNRVGSWQLDAFANHDHEIFPKLSGHNQNVGNYLQGSPIQPRLYGNARTGYAGGNETRPKNVYVNYIIKY